MGDVKRTYAEHLKAKDASCLGQWCLFHGPEQHLKREALATLRQEAREAGAGEEPTWEVLDGISATASDVLNRSQTGALFGGARVVVIREAERMAPPEQDSLSKAVGPLPPGVSVVLVTGETGDRGRRKAVRAALGRALAKEGLVIDFRSLSVREAASWAARRAKELGKKLEPSAARKLVEQKVGVGLGELESEIQKLVLFVGEEDVITGAHVDEVSPRLVEEDIFRLLDAVGRREAGRAVGILRGLLGDRREEPGRVLGMLGQTIRLIWQTKLLVEHGWRPGKDVDEETAALLPQDERKNALAQFRRRSWIVQRTVRQASQLTWEQLGEAIQALHGCDLAIKRIRGKLADPAAALELLVIQLCTDVDLSVWESRSGERVLG
jgi:DNA polymerase-3 subunit delta